MISSLRCGFGFGVGELFPLKDRPNCAIGLFPSINREFAYEIAEVHKGEGFLLQIGVSVQNRRQPSLIGKVRFARHAAI